jgi:capsular exopolysaccharide synthesis family protein
MNSSDNGHSTSPVPESSMFPQIGPVFDIKRFLWLRVPLMVIVAICVAIPAVTAAWFLVPVGYTATGELRFLATRPYVLNRESADSTSYEGFRATQLSLISGSTILSRVLDSPAIREIPAIAAATDPLIYLKQRVAARVQRGSEIVEISCTMPDKDSAQRVTQEVIDVYMNYAMGEEAATGSERLTTLTKERDARQIELESQLKKIGDLQASLGVPIVGQTPLETGEGVLYNESLARAEEELAKAQNAQAEVQAEASRIDGLLKGSATASPVYEFGLEERVNADGRVAGLRQEILMRQISLAMMTDAQQDDSPQIKAEQKRLTRLEGTVTQLQSTVRKEILESLRTQKTQAVDAAGKVVEEAQQRVTKFKELADGYKERLKSTTDQYAQVEDLKSKADETRQTLLAVRDRIASINMESNAPARIRLAAPVTVPGGGPDYTPRFMAMLMALVASGGLGFGIGLLRELMDQQIRSSQDLARLTSLPIIAAIPHASEDSLLDSVRTDLLTEEAPLSILSDEYRRILARLLYPAAEQGEMKSVVVVSPTRGDGKSSLSTNLGVALARAGRRVLLVDVSYRRPTLEKRLDLPEDVGLAEILNKTTTPDHAIRAARVPGLFVLGPGLDTGGLAGRLASRRMARFLTVATEGFDQVIIDTPPWLIMADAKLITPLVDGVVVVVGSGISTLGMVRRCLRELSEVKANVAGVVLNGVRRTPGGYMAKNQHLYYGYAHEGGAKRSLEIPIAVGVADGLSVEPETALWEEVGQDKE